MNHEPRILRRRPVRLKGYDYSQPGAYFVTICADRQACLFGEVRDGRMRPNDHGRIAWRCWEDLPRYYPHVRIDSFVAMPNHVHGIIVLTEIGVGAGLRPAPTESGMGFRPHALPEIVRAFKAFSARRINELRNMSGGRVWQRSYYERVVRNEEELNRIRQYIAENPSRWSEDEYHPSHAGSGR
ncbi:MAG: transposase [Anaerolineae bacterium]|nr:transposase [Anaerolineae bacterium]